MRDRFGEMLGRLGGRRVLMPARVIPALLASAVVHAATPEAGMLLQMPSKAGELARIDVDSGQITGPSRVRVELVVSDRPRRVSVGEGEELCLQLRPAERGLELALRRVSGDVMERAVLRVSGPGIFPGTFRTTSAGLLVRLVVRESEYGWRKAGVDDLPAACEL